MDRNTQANPVDLTAPKLSRQEIADRESQNGLEQYDAAIKVIEQSLTAGAFKLRPSLILEMNRLAVKGVDIMPGNLRIAPVAIDNTDHMPPPSSEVPALVEEMCDYVNDSEGKSALHIAAYLLWRINWIHPFFNGNGRTARIISYIALCAHLKMVLPGKNTIPDQLSNDKSPYYSCLDLADAAWKEGRIDVTAMEQMLEGLLVNQLGSVVDTANGEA